MKTPHISSVEKPVVGTFYLVPAVFTRRDRWTNSDWVPVNGPAHEDTDVIGFPEEHYHPDFRFMSDLWMKNRLDWTRGESPARRIFGYVVSVKNVATGPVLKRLKCHRPTPTFAEPSDVPWLRKLEAKYAGSHARCDVCPHRGISLKGAPVRNGARVCPGHGLAWSTKDGSLAPRPFLQANPSRVRIASDSQPN